MKVSEWKDTLIKRYGVNEVEVDELFERNRKKFKECGFCDERIEKELDSTLVVFEGILWGITVDYKIDEKEIGFLLSKLDNKFFNDFGKVINKPNNLSSKALILRQLFEMRTIT